MQRRHSGYQALQMDPGQTCWLGAEDWVLSMGLGTMMLWQSDAQNMLVGVCIHMWSQEDIFFHLLC